MERAEIIATIEQMIAQCQQAEAFHEEKAISEPESKKFHDQMWHDNNVRVVILGELLEKIDPYQGKQL